MVMLSQRVVINNLNKTKKLLFSPSRALFSSNPLDKFDEILSFHDGVAAALDTNGNAYHIDQNGTAVYDTRRYKRTFGFYAAQRAAVIDFDDNWFHIDLTGYPVYGNRYAWCGNFHAMPEEGLFRSPVRDNDNHYYYIDHHGETALGPFSYAGDPNSSGHSVVHDLDGNPNIINFDGRHWCTTTTINERKLIEACVPHKGIAVVRDEDGWFYINQAGKEVGRGRYLFAEPHYNGQARVRFLNGQWGVVDEAGQAVVNLGESMLSSAVELENISKRYWESLALKHILENNVLQEPATTTLGGVLNDCSIEMGLLRQEEPSEATSNPTAQLLNRGKLLIAAAGDASSVTEARCRYWLQDRYLNAWLDCPQQETPVRDTFAELASDPILVEQSHKVLKSYADADWKGAAPVFLKLLRSSEGGDTKPIHTIVDMGGGYGSLLTELQGSGLLRDTTEFICIDRPEVVAASVSSIGLPASSPAYSTSSDLDYQQQRGDSIKHEVGDLFEGPLHSADLYLMSRVLHDWSDFQATAILKRMHSLSPEGARLVVIDRISTPDKLHALLSLHMFMLQGSHERTHEQWQGLFTSSGWQIDGREHFNGHEMYMLTKTLAVKPVATPAADTCSNSPNSSCHNTKDAAVETPAVRKAVITAGGLGTRMAPQSAITPKALLPVISHGHQTNSVGLQSPSWEVRPALAYILDQLHDSSHTVDQVCIVSSPQQIPLLQSFLRDYLPQQQQQQKQQQNATSDISTTSNTTGNKELSVQIVTQDSARGFGDAVLAARWFIGNDPFVLAMGDHIFSSACVKDMLSAYKKLVSSSDWRNTALTGATLCNESEVQQTGLLRNDQSLYPPGNPWLVDEMVEKPSSNYESFQLLEGGSVKYPSQLGIDVLPPSIFPLLQAEKDQIAPHQEVDLRKVLQKSMLGNGCLFGCLIDGQRLDIGNPRAYFKALQAIANDESCTYLPPPGRSLAQVQELQEQDEILQSVCAIQQENSSNIPATLRHVLFGRDDASLSDSTEIHISSSPGRMDIMCGFADYSGSNAIQHLTSERVVTLAIFDDITNALSAAGGREEQGMIRLASIQVPKLSEMSRAIAAGEFVPRETAFPTRDLFTTSGGLKSDDELRTTLSEKFPIVDAPDRWVHYLAGIIHRICHQRPAENKLSAGAGFTVVTVSDLPWNTGLASSAAVEVAAAISLGRAMQLPAHMLEPVSLAMLCKEVENHAVGGQCGIMDQLAVTHPGAITTEHALVGMQCRLPLGERPTYSLPIPEGLSVIAVESGVKRSTVSSAYQRVRTGATVGKCILESFHGEEIQHLCDLTPSQFAKYENLLPKTMTNREVHNEFPGLLRAEEDFGNEDSFITFPVRAATCFPIEENLRVQTFESMLRGLHSYAVPRELGLQLLGELMRQTHAGYSKCGLGNDATTFLVDALNATDNGAIGAKISGGGGGGAVVALVNDSFLRNSLPFEQLQERYYTKTRLRCTLRRGTSGASKYHGALRRQFSTFQGAAGQDHYSHSTKPRVLVVNHGFPPDFNGGSEVYAQAVALQLKNSGQCESVHVFAREHDPYRGDFEIRRTVDHLDSELPVFRMNYSREAPYFRFMAEEVDRAFQEVVDEVKPDIVHLHHMNHLSLNIPAVAKAAGAKVIYTLHDYWLMCPRGQFLQTGAARNDPWKLCDGQENGKCAKHCYASRYASGVYDPAGGDDHDDESSYWTSWIASRMEATRKACEHIDAFIAPSQHLYNKFVNEFSLPADKVIVEPYGFFRDRLVNRQHYHGASSSSIDEGPSTPTLTTNEDPPYVFAYIGRHQPGKGINLLVEASLKLLQDTNDSDSGSGNNEDVPFRVKIFGRQEANSSRSLQRMIAQCPHPRAKDIFSWEAEYVNKDIVERVFNVVDCVVVPSIWEENSPLVIHEAQQCRVPVITSSYGGMGELVKNHVNGLNFEHRSADSLAEAMRMAAEQPAGMRHLGERGYLYSPDGQIPCIESHIDTLLQLFQTLQSKDSENSIAKAASSSWYTAAQTTANTRHETEERRI